MKETFSEAAWAAYLQLAEERPMLFRQDERLAIILDEAEARAFSARTGRTLGVVYRSPYSMMVVDLVRSPDGRCFAYERQVPTATGQAVVTVPVCRDRYALLLQFRHAARRTLYTFPRGFGENGLTAEENAVKELSEELGARVLSTETLGAIAVESAGDVAVVRCEVDDIQLKKDYEGIQNVSLLTEQELNQWIAEGRLTDGFTLAAWALYQAREKPSKA